MHYYTTARHILDSRTIITDKNGGGDRADGGDEGEGDRKHEHNHDDDDDDADADNDN